MISNEEILKAILDNTPESVVLISKEHKVIAFNRKIQDALYAFFKKNIQTGDDYREYVAENSIKLYLDSFENALKGDPTNVHHETISENHSVWYEFNMSPVYSENKELLGICLTAKDIDNEKKAHLELENLANTLNAIFEHAAESVILLSPNYITLAINKSAKERIQTHINKLPVKGDDFRDYLYPGHLDLFHSLFTQALNGESTITEIESTNAEGKTVWFQSRMNPVYDSQNRIFGVSLFSQHITDRKLAELALKESEEKFRSIINAAPIPIVIVNDEMEIVESNPQFTKVFGYNIEEIIHKNINLLLSKKARNSEGSYEITFSNNYDSNEPGNEKVTPVKTKSGKKLNVEISLNSYKLNNKTYIIASIVDVTGHLKNETMIKDQLERLKEIAWHQSHIVRAPVAKILGIMNVMKEEDSLEKFRQTEWFEMLQSSAEELDNVIRKIVLLTNRSKKEKKTE